MLASISGVPECGRIIHRDLTPFNMLAENGRLVAVIDWDHAGFSAPQEDIGKTIIGLLSMLSLPHSLRLMLIRTFLNAYCEISSSSDELFLQSVPFALDTILDWLVGGKNAPREELAWATEQILYAKLY